jgi:hypothetical protein
MKVREIHPLIEAEMAFLKVKQSENVNKQYNLTPAYWVRDPVWLNLKISLHVIP